MLDSIPPQLDRLAAILLPVRERSNRQVLAQARFGCAVIGALVLIALIRVPMLISTGLRSQATVLSICALLALLLPVIPRVSGSFVLVAHALVLLTLVPLVSLIHFTGGCSSPALLALVVTPMIAVFLTGRHGGVRWSLAVGSIICAYAIIDRLGLSPPIVFPPEAWKLEKSVGAFLLTMTVLSLALSYERSRHLAETDAVRAAKEAVDLVAMNESDHRESLRWLSHSFAHEANNTLAYVMADLAHIGDDPTTRRDAEAGTAARLGAERLRQIVRDVQTIAGAGGPQPEGECVNVDLRLVVSGVVEELGPLLRGLGMRVQPAPAGEPISVRSVPSTLARCVASSLIAFAPETEIEVRLEQGPSPAVVLSARRDALEARPLATEALRRTLATFGGSLVIAQNAEGATVRLELNPAPSPIKEPTRPTPKEEAKKARVLIVDDEALLLRVTARMLPGYDVTTTSSARDALKRLASGGIDVLLCDFNMPEMRGDALLASAIDLGFDRTHVVVMTGGSYEEVESAFGLSPPLVLPKPFTQKELESAIRRSVSG